MASPVSSVNRTMNEKSLSPSFRLLILAELQEQIVFAFLQFDIADVLIDL